MLNVIPIFGWMLSFVFSVSLAVPFWICWTVCRIGEDFFYFLPKTYQSVGFWNCVGIFMVVSILKAVLTPHSIMNINNTNKKD